MKVGVTGGAGFIGSALCRELQARGHQVVSLDNYFTGSPDNHVPGVEYRRGHVRDIARLMPESLDLLFHLGEYSRVEKSFEEPGLVWDLNSAGTFAALEYCRARKGLKMVYAGSSTKFGDGGMGRDQSPYAWTKASNTELVRNYGTWYGMPYAITYFYNTYGPGERAGAFGTVVEIFHQQWLNHRPLTVVAPGTQKRNFTHVDDIVAGLILVGERGEGDDYGLGAEQSYSVMEVARLFGCAIEMLPERRGNRMAASLDIAKLQGMGWRATRRLPDYIAELVTKGRD
jgi:UDP-glucose 4-epimerase